MKYHPKATEQMGVTCFVEERVPQGEIVVLNPDGPIENRQLVFHSEEELAVTLTLHKQAQDSADRVQDAIAEVEKLVDPD